MSTSSASASSHAHVLSPSAAVQASSLQKLSLLPVELIDAISERVKRRQPLSAVFGLLYLSRFTSSITRLEFGDLSTSIISSFLSDISTLSPRKWDSIKSVALPSHVGDSIFKILAESILAPTLEELSMRSNQAITDDSSHYWQRFSSLKTLILGSSYITMTSYGEIFTQIPCLTALDLSLSNDSFAALAVEKLLEPRSRPCLLQDISLEFSSFAAKAEEVVVRLLKANRDLCSSLKRLSWNWTSSHIPFRLLELCPALVTFCQLPWSELTKHQPDMKHFQELDIVISESESVSSREIDWLASNFPSLTSLRIADYSRGHRRFALGESLRALTCLKSLHVGGNSWSTFSFPASLRSLELNFRHAAASEFPFEEFISCIPSELRQLNSLSILAWNASPQKYEAILSQLPCLETVKFMKHCQFKNRPTAASSSSAVLAHPRLQSFTNFDLALDWNESLVFGDLPKLTSLISFGDSVSKLVRTVPNLAHLGVDSCASDLESIKFLPELRGLSCVDPSLEQVQSVARTSCLTALFLFEVSPHTVSESALEVLLKSLETLRTLEIRLAARSQPHASFDWLRHDHLQRFEYSAPGATRDDLVSFGSKPLTFVHLPSLRALSFAMLCYVRRFEMLVEGLHSLESVNIRVSASTADAGDGWVGSSVRIRRCPSLCSVWIGYVDLSLLEMSDLPNLKRLSLFRSPLAAEACQVAVPSLLRLVIQTGSWSDLAVPRLIGDLIKAHAPFAECIVQA